MKRHPASLPLVAAALAFTLAACGGSHHDEAQQPAPGSTAQLPPQPPYTAAQPAPPATAEQPMGAGSSGMPPTNGSAGAAAQTPGFEQLAGTKGYITQQDAQRSPWLSRHFAQCDANGDGRITRDEYSRCRQGPAQNTMQQPPALPPQAGSSSG